MTSEDQQQRRKPEEVEPEVIPPQDGEPRMDASASWFERLNQAFGPIASGVIIDSLDVATFGRFGFIFGMAVGGTAAFWMCSIYKLPLWQRFLWALAAGFYCTFPRTEFIPLATLIGAAARYVHTR